MILWIHFIEQDLTHLNSSNFLVYFCLSLLQVLFVDQSVIFQCCLPRSVRYTQSCFAKSCGIKMKRKSGRKSSKKDEENSNDIENTEQNGESVEHDDEPPKDKKRKSSKGGRKSVTFTKKEENDAVQCEEISDDDEAEEAVKEEKKSKSKRSSKSSSNKEGNKESNKEGNKEIDPLADSEDEPEEPEKKKSKKGKKSKEKKEEVETSSEKDEDDETQYEVESVLDEKNIKGVKHYLIRWKGYQEESDTWEPEDTLDCKELIEEFKKKKKDDKGPKKPKKKVSKESAEPNWDENEDFEVDRILEVHFKKNGKREFLVSWKGYPSTDNSWEPEENMDCKDLIEKFMTKVKKAKLFDDRELRANRKQVQRYTMNTPDTGRRLSRRGAGKERVQYHDAE